MSYFDSLSSWQQAGNAIQQQQEDSEKEQREQKAQNIAEKFSNVDKLLGESGGGIAGLGGGVHIGVRMYRKAQKKASDAKKAFEEAKKKLNGGGTKPEADGEGAKTPSEHTSQPNGQEDQPPKGKAKAKEDSKPEDEPAEEPPEAGEAPKAGDGDTDKSLEGDGEDEEIQGFDATPEMRAKADADMGRNDLQKQHDIADNQIAENQKIVDGQDGPVYDESDGRIAQSKIDAHEQFKKDNPLPDKTEAPKPTEPEPPKPTETEPQFNKEGLGQSEDGGVRVGNNAGTGESGSSEITTSGADEGGTVVSDLADRAGSMVDKVKGTIGNISDKVSDLKSTVTDGAGDMLKAGAEKIAGQAGKDALETASGVLDFLGPIGELVGAGLALGSFFHDLFDKKKNERKQQQAESTGAIDIPSAGGISTTSMTVASEKSNVVGTVV